MTDSVALNVVGLLPIAFAFVLTNWVEIFGTLTGVGGALMLAMKSRYAAFVWPIWILSNLAWIVWALEHGSFGTLIQQGVFLIINLIGVWRWNILPALEASKSAHNWRSKAASHP